MKTGIIVSIALGGLLVGACTTSERVTIRQPGDMSMSCDEIQREFREIERVVDDAQGDQGVNTANVAAVLFFWPAAVGNYVGAERALEAAEERQDWLYELYQEKDCEGML
ncbi:hypothetical protein ACWCOP_14880 [Maricaulaceae bacterium MS644]